MKTLVFTLCFIIESYAAFEFSATNAFLKGMANSTIATTQFFSAFLLNPAISSAVKEGNLGLTYFKPYGISELNYAGLVFNIPFKNIGTGLAVSTFGNQLYRESQFIINFSKSFFKNKLFAGFNTHWYSVSVERYGNTNSLGMDAGLQYVINSKMLIGFSIHNFNQPELNGCQEEIPVITNWGISVGVDDRFHAYLAIQKDAWFPLNFMLGMNFKASSTFSVQSGFSTYPSSPTIGFYLERSKIRVNYVFQYHFDLGVTHLWGVSFHKKAK